MLEHIRAKWSLPHRPADPARAATERPASTERPTSWARPQREPQPPECETEHWKRQVEGEARNRLKRRVRNIGARRA
jgi:hypothetical protein